MKTTIALLFICALFNICSCFKTFSEIGDLRRCYDNKNNIGSSEDKVNGQEFPLPNTIETFISLVERIELAETSLKVHELIRQLLISYRVDNIPSKLTFEDPVWEKNNVQERALLSIDNLNSGFKNVILSKDEECALHFMLSHTINDTLQGSEESTNSDQKISNHPRESGVVSILGKKTQAFALGKVLLGIYAGLLGNNQNIEAREMRRKFGLTVTDGRLDGVKINRLTAVTIADLITLYIKDETHKRGEVIFMPNGEWNEVSCPTTYSLESNIKGRISTSLIRGAIDGLIIGKKIEEKPDYFRRLKLSQILRMYYGSTGLLDETMSSKGDSKTEEQWCRRSEKFRTFTTLNEEILNYLKLDVNLQKDIPTDDYMSEINEIISHIQGSADIFNENADEPSLCGRVDPANEKCKTPTDIFAILDWQGNENGPVRKFQIEVLGILSNNLDMRPKGSSLGAYANLNSAQNKGLHTIVNNTGIPGCAACYAKHVKRTQSTRQGEVEVLNYLNQTLTEFIDYQTNALQSPDGIKVAAPAKVVLLFNFGNPANDYRLQNAVWEIRKNFREVTILAIGPKKESLTAFTENHDTDIFTDSGNTGSSAVFSSKLKPRICKAPAEFQFTECYTNNRGTEAENKKTGFIPVNKKQYYAMYPKYFLKSYNIKMKLKALDGAHIKVCFSRSYFRIIEEGTQYKECGEAGEEKEFWVKDPCKKKNVDNCEPFYFSIEGVKPGSGLCESVFCSTPKDIAFEFIHEGISCNTASFLVSSPILLATIIIFILKKKNCLFEI